MLTSLLTSLYNSMSGKATVAKDMPRCYNDSIEVKNMKRKGLSQEGLKLLACITMLIDHVGAALVVPNDTIYHANVELYTTMAWINLVLRCIGRIAFPIFCFLLVEGVYHTRDPKKYVWRLAVGMMLSEIPFDLAFFRDGISWAHQSVMVTLLLGCLMVLLMNRSKGFWRVLWILPFYFAAEWLRTDYGGDGILLIALFALAKGRKHEKWWQLAAMFLLYWDLSFTCGHYNLDICIPMNRLPLMAAVPIFFYDGRKRTYSRAIQWAFYLFYPAHIAVLCVLKAFVLS